ncbi:hypothetical protein B0H11DRAFT_2257744 [Mycena galericulata]|nr:hypothetical protein B0H11DRAFT_2257744 [Mycena galericulata]
METLSARCTAELYAHATPRHDFCLAGPAHADSRSTRRCIALRASRLAGRLRTSPNPGRAGSVPAQYTSTLTSGTGHWHGSGGFDMDVGGTRDATPDSTRGPCARCSVLAALTSGEVLRGACAMRISSPSIESLQGPGFVSQCHEKPFWDLIQVIVTFRGQSQTNAFFPSGDHRLTQDKIEHWRRCGDSDVGGEGGMSRAYVYVKGKLRRLATLAGKQSTYARAHLPAGPSTPITLPNHPPSLPQVLHLDRGRTYRSEFVSPPESLMDIPETELRRCQIDKATHILGESVPIDLVFLIFQPRHPFVEPFPEPPPRHLADSGLSLATFASKLRRSGSSTPHSHDSSQDSSHSPPLTSSDHGHSHHPPSPRLHGPRPSLASTSPITFSFPCIMRVTHAGAHPTASSLRTRPRSTARRPLPAALRWRVRRRQQGDARARAPVHTFLLPLGGCPPRLDRTVGVVHALAQCRRHPAIPICVRREDHCPLGLALVTATKRMEVPSLVLRVPRPTPSVSLRALSTTLVQRFESRATSEHEPTQQFFVGNVSFEATEADVRDSAAVFGEVESVRMRSTPTDRAAALDMFYLQAKRAQRRCLRREPTFSTGLYALTTPPHAQRAVGLPPPLAPSACGPLHPSGPRHLCGQPSFGTEEADVREKIEPFGPRLCSPEPNLRRPLGRIWA